MLVIGTGLSGLVGSRVVELLKDKFTFVDLSLDTGIDITDFFSLEKVFLKNKKAPIVLHLAAFTDVDAAWKQRGDKNGLCYRVNVIGTENIAQLCARHGKYLIAVSTDFVFDGKNPPFGGYVETNSPCPIEWYGQTKYLAEKEVERSGVKFCIARIAFPFRARFSGKADLVRKIIRGFGENSLPALFTDQIITPTFIDDIALAINSLIKQTPQGIFHAVGSTFLSPYQLALQVAEIFSFDQEAVKKGSLEEYVKKTGRPRQRNITLNNHKLSKELQIKMRAIRPALEALKGQLNEV